MSRLQVLMLNCEKNLGYCEKINENGTTIVLTTHYTRSRGIESRVAIINDEIILVDEKDKLIKKLSKNNKN